MSSTLLSCLCPMPNYKSSVFVYTSIMHHMCCCCMYISGYRLQKLITTCMDLIWLTLTIFVGWFGRPSAPGRRTQCMAEWVKAGKRKSAGWVRARCCANASLFSDGVWDGHCVTARISGNTCCKTLVIHPWGLSTCIICKEYLTCHCSVQCCCSC